MKPQTAAIRIGIIHDLAAMISSIILFNISGPCRESALTVPGYFHARYSHTGSQLTDPCNRST